MRWSVGQRNLCENIVHGAHAGKLGKQHRASLCGRELGIEGKKAAEHIGEAHAGKDGAADGCLVPELGADNALRRLCKGACGKACKFLVGAGALDACHGTDMDLSVDMFHIVKARRCKVDRIGKVLSWRRSHIMPPSTVAWGCSSRSASASSGEPGRAYSSKRSKDCLPLFVVRLTHCDVYGAISAVRTLHTARYACLCRPHVHMGTRCLSAWKC